MMNNTQDLLVFYDLFGNVFGRSKRTVQGSNSDKVEGSSDNVDKNMIAPTVNSIYPRFTGNFNPLNGPDLKASVRSGTLERQLSSNYSPIDGIPFVNGPTLKSSYSGINQSINLDDCFHTIDKIGVFLSTPSLSNYDLYLEKQFLVQYQ